MCIQTISQPLMLKVKGEVWKKILTVQVFETIFVKN